MLQLYRVLILRDKFELEHFMFNQTTVHGNIHMHMCVRTYVDDSSESALLRRIRMLSIRKASVLVGGGRTPSHSGIPS